MRLLSEFFKNVVTAVVLLSTAILPSTVALGAEGSLEEYYAKLSEVSPRDASGFYTLALWCQENGLGTEKQKSLKRTIRIDPDHAEARQALGYARYGLGWRLTSEIPQRINYGDDPDDIGSESRDTGDVGDSAPESRAVVKKRRRVSAGGDDESPESEEESGASSEVRNLTAEQKLEKKKSWAAEAAKKARLDLNTTESRRDFLIHSTFASNSNQVKDFVARLKAARKHIAKAIGVGSRSEIWPHKLQFFLLRGLECARFSESALERRFSESSGWEMIDDYSLLVRDLSDFDLTRFMSSTALRGGGKPPGGERWVASWLEEGMAQFIAAGTREGQERGLREQALRMVASRLENSPGRSPLMDLLETPDVRRRNLDRNRNVGMTAIDFLTQQRRRRLSKFIDETSKGETPPKGRREFKDFYLDYFNKQESLFKKIYRLAQDKLDEKWQEFIFEEVKALDDAEREDGERREKESKRQERRGKQDQEKRKKRGRER